MHKFEEGVIVFYEKFVQLCAQRGISPSKAATEAGLSKSTVTKWKNAPNATPTGAAIQKLTEYFGITVSELLGEETKNAPADEGKRTVTDDDIKFALFGGDGDVTDEMYAEVRSFAAFVKAKNKKE